MVLRPPLTCGDKSPGLRRSWRFRWGPARWTRGLRARRCWRGPAA